MTLYELCKAATIQGDVRISIFEDGEEETVIYIDQVIDDLLWDLSCQPEYENGMEDYEVNYMFAGKDGYLHIELVKED